MMFFMHLKFEGNWKFVLLAPTTILAIGLPLALFPDIGASYYTSIAPQTNEWAGEISEYQAHHAARKEAAAVKAAAAAAE
jgi:cytochrome c oxidase subunit 4